ncbi:MAG: GYF domain-containing protein [Byssovorax sp.]
MKFVCDSCKAKYQIGDEKVTARGARMKCRRCGHEMIVSFATAVHDDGSSPTVAPLPEPSQPVAHHGLPKVEEESTSDESTAIMTRPLRDAVLAATGAVAPAAAPRAPAAPIPPAAPSRPVAPVPPAAPSRPIAPAPVAAPVAPAPLRTPLPVRPLGTPAAPAASPAAPAAAPGSKTPLPRPAARPLGAPAAAPAAPARPVAPLPPAAPARPAPLPARPLPAPRAASPLGAPKPGAGPQPPAFPTPPPGDASMRAPHAPPPHLPPEGWFVGLGGGPFGPTTLAVLREKAAAGEITGDTLVWHEGQAEWQPLKSNAELLELLKSVQAINRIAALKSTPPPPDAALSGMAPPPVGRSKFGLSQPPAGSAGASAHAPIPAAARVPTDLAAAVHAPEPKHAPVAPAPPVAPLPRPAPTAPIARPAPAPKPIAHPAPAPAPIAHPAPAPIAHPAPAPIAHPAPAPVAHPAPAPIAHPAPAPIEHPAPAPIEHPAPAPIEHPAPAPIAHPAPAPAPIAHPEPAPAAFQPPPPAPIEPAPAAPVAFAPPPPAAFVPLPAHSEPQAAPAPVPAPPPSAPAIAAPPAATATPLPMSAPVVAATVVPAPRDHVEIDESVVPKPRSAPHPFAYAFIAAAAVFGGVAAWAFLAKPQQIIVVQQQAAPTNTATAKPEDSAAVGQVDVGDLTTDNPAATVARLGGPMPSAKPKASAAPTTSSTFDASGFISTVPGPAATAPGDSQGAAGGQLSAGEIQGVVTRNQPLIRRRCWQPALDGRPPNGPNSARVSGTINIAPNGSVTSATASGAEKDFPGLSSCIAAQMKNWKFPASGAPSTAAVPFYFAGQ